MSLWMRWCTIKTLSWTLRFSHPPVKLYCFRPLAYYRSRSFLYTYAFPRVHTLFCIYICIYHTALQFQLRTHHRCGLRCSRLHPGGCISSAMLSTSEISPTGDQWVADRQLSPATDVQPRIRLCSSHSLCIGFVHVRSECYLLAHIKAVHL